MLSSELRAAEGALRATELLRAAELAERAPPPPPPSLPHRAPPRGHASGHGSGHASGHASGYGEWERPRLEQELQAALALAASAQRAAAEAEQRGAVAAALAEQAAAARAVVTHILSLESTSGARDLLTFRRTFREKASDKLLRKRNIEMFHLVLLHLVQT